MDFNKTQNLVLTYLIDEFSKNNGYGIDSEKIYNDFLVKYPKLKISEQEIKEAMRFLIHNTDFFIDCSSFGDKVAVLPKNNGTLSNYSNLVKEKNELKNYSIGWKNHNLFNWYSNICRFYL